MCTLWSDDALCMHPSIVPFLTYIFLDFTVKYNKYHCTRHQKRIESTSNYTICDNRTNKPVTKVNKHKILQTIQPTYVRKFSFIRVVRKLNIISCHVKIDSIIKCNYDDKRLFNYLGILSRNRCHIWLSIVYFKCQGLVVCVIIVIIYIGTLTIQFLGLIL